ncbi:MAG TPA: PAS domain S-box protein [Thermoanaerobaculia bacterium]|nr:PAS domain S-box protein [Thermoanaerobaculia bacterium]
MDTKNSPSRELWDQLPTAVLLVDASGRVLEANRAAAELLGSAPPGKSLFELAGESRTVLEEKLASVLSTGRPAELELTAGRPDGTRFLFGMGMSRVGPAADGKVLILGRDLESVRLGRRYRELFDRSPEPIVVTRPDTGAFLDSNSAFERLIGRSREQMQADGVSPVPVPTRLGTGVESWQEAEVSVETPDGRTLRLQTRTGLYTLEGEPLLVTFIRDETAMLAAERRYQQIFRQAAEAIAITDDSGQRFLDANPSFEVLSGYALEELRTMDCDRLWELPDGEWRQALAASREGSVSRASFIARASGRIPVALRWSPLGHQNRGGWMVVVHDLRAELKAEELERSLALVQRSQALGQMASGIAHDFNNTLMAALPWADLLSRKFPEEETIRKATDQIRRAVQRAREVTRQLLDFAQPKKPEKRRTSLAALVRQQLRMIRPAIPPEIAIEVSAADEGWVDVDAAQIGQALLNLALNGRDAMPAGGELHLEIRRPTPSEVVRWEVDAASTVLLSVRDTGRGIPEHELQSIFDPFFTTKEIGSGPGLGLPVALRIIQQHEGSIYVDSEPGAGTTFYVLLPASAKVDKPTPGPAETGLRDGRGRLDGVRVFIADDEVIVLEGLLALLEIEGAHASGWTTGEALLERLERGDPPDLVVLDLGMPGLGGKEAHRRIRLRFPELPVLISSGYGDGERIESVQDARTRYLQKPYDSDALCAAIGELLG